MFYIFFETYLTSILIRHSNESCPGQTPIQLRLHSSMANGRHSDCLWLFYSVHHPTKSTPCHWSAPTNDPFSHRTKYLRRHYLFTLTFMNVVKKNIIVYLFILINIDFKHIENILLTGNGIIARLGSIKRSVFMTIPRADMKLFIFLREEILLGCFPVFSCI